MSKCKKIIICSLITVLLLGLIIVGCRSTERPSDDVPDTERQSETNDPAEDPAVTPPVNGEENGIYEVTEIIDRDFRAVWVASVMNLDFPSRRDLNAAAMKREINEIVDRTAQLGLNAIIFQVRPTGDSFYESDIFPWSHWLSGTQGQGIPDFDPLEYWIEVCHAQNIELHAWLNPYRIIHTQTNSSDPGTLSPDNPVYKNPELAVGWTNSRGNKGLFLDPGLPEARQLIIDGIIEIALRYDVDGIHIDDYFYPGMDFDDSASYQRYGNGMDHADWRRENVNTLIKGIQTAIREVNESFDKNIRWGISPTAIWKNGSSDPLGVPTTRGQESFHELYADTRLWVMEEWVDYICPQIYWYIGFERADFKAVFNWWVDLCRDYDVDLYIGHAAYREHENDQPPHWQGEMLRQLEMVESTQEVSGSVFYRFHSLRGTLGNTIRDFYTEEEPVQRQPVMILDTLSVGMPAKDVVLTSTAANAPGHNVVGTSVPGIPLFVNGEEVTNRTIEGFFFVFVPLESGVNEFTFSQEGQEDVTRKITVNAPGGGGGGGGTVTVTQVTTPRFATVTSNDAWLFPGNSISGGSDWMLQRGQIDQVTAESSNNFVKLSCGMWVNKSAVSISSDRTRTSPVFRNGVYRPGTDHDMLVWEASLFTAVHAFYNGNSLRLDFGMHDEAPLLTLPASLTQTMFTDYSRGIDDGVPYYEFTIRDDINFEGYFVEYENGEFRVYLKKRKTPAPGDRPLTGISIVLDAGHGGEASGALGPLGYEMAEKDINLINTLKLAERLKALGATVHLTRETDIDVTLQERVNITWRNKPDLFISLHINSVAETTNAVNVRGFSVWHRNPGSINISQTMLDVLYNIIPDSNRHRTINQANFFVCRPTWTPAVLLEAGFIININDFVWLITPENQEKMAEATADAVLEYFMG